MENDRNLTLILAQVELNHDLEALKSYVLSHLLLINRVSSSKYLPHSSAMQTAEFFIFTSSCSSASSESENRNLFGLRSLMEFGWFVQDEMIQKCSHTVRITRVFNMNSSYFSLFLFQFSLSDRAKRGETFAFRDIAATGCWEMVEISQVDLSRICCVDPNYPIEKHWLIRISPCHFRIRRAKLEGSQCFKKSVVGSRLIAELFSGPIEDTLDYRMMYFLLKYKLLLNEQEDEEVKLWLFCWCDPNYTTQIPCWSAFPHLG
jgi:hypothetical protein